MPSTLGELKVSKESWSQHKQHGPADWLLIICALSMGEIRALRDTETDNSP